MSLTKCHTYTNLPPKGEDDMNEINDMIYLFPADASRQRRN